MIAIDGKVLRRSYDKGIGKAAIDMVSAWASANRLVLGQVKVDEKSNEITAIPHLLKALEIAGCIVTIDAMGCQTDIAEQIIDQEAEYVLALKENQSHLYEDVEHLFADLEDSQYKAYGFDYEKTVNKDHGRIEIRECWTISDPEVLRHLRGLANWKNLTTIRGFDLNVGSVKKRAVKTAIISPASREPNPSWGPCARIGVSRMSYTGHWISPLTKIVAECAKIMGQKTLPCYGISP